MTIDNKHNFADAEGLLDNDCYSHASFLEPTALPVSPTAIAEPILLSKADEKVSSRESSAVASNSVADPEHRDRDRMNHNVHHKSNIVTGIISRILIGSILLGPIGVTTGAVIGSSIVKRRGGCLRHRFRCRYHSGSNTRIVRAERRVRVVS